MATVDSLPIANSINPADRLVVNQTNPDGSLTLRRVTAANAGLIPDGQTIQLSNGVLSVVFGTTENTVASGEAVATAQATAQQALDTVQGTNTGTIVSTAVTNNEVQVTVTGLPVIPTTGGYCLINGTIVAQDTATRDATMWNITLLTRRTANNPVCDIMGDSDPSQFNPNQGSLSNLVPPELNSGTFGPIIVLTGMPGVNITWGINLNSTTGD